MVISTYPYDVSDEDTEDSAPYGAVASVKIQPNRESIGVNDVHHFPRTTSPPSGAQREKTIAPKKPGQKPLSAYDLWIYHNTLKTQQERGNADDRSDSKQDMEVGRIYEKSKWRQRRNRRRMILLGVMFIGLLIVLASISVGLVRRARHSLTKDPPMEQSSKIPPSSIVLNSNSYMEPGAYVYSPNRQYKSGLSETGNFVLTDKLGNILWSTETGGGVRLFLQSDGNLVLKDTSKQTVWKSQTHANEGAVLVVDDAGMISIVSNAGTKVWLNGIPRGSYNGPSSADLTFPTRGIFYYPWFPGTFEVNGAPVKFEPSLGRYSSSDPKIAQAHVDAMEYAHINLSIASWWGPDTHLERARLTMLMDTTIAMGSPLKWSIYHEDGQDNPSTESIKTDLDYLKKWFAWHSAWAHVDGRPVIFVYNDGGCDVISRWMAASNGEWYVVLKLFPGFEDCPEQPDHWVS
jgi:Glycosyl hydrolase family 99